MNISRHSDSPRPLRCTFVADTRQRTLPCTQIPGMRFIHHSFQSMPGFSAERVRLLGTPVVGAWMPVLPGPGMACVPSAGGRFYSQWVDRSLGWDWTARHPSTNDNDLDNKSSRIEAIYLALRWPVVVGGFMGCIKPRTRWIGLLAGRGGWNQHCPGFDTAVFGLQSLISDYIP